MLPPNERGFEAVRTSFAFTLVGLALGLTRLYLRFFTVKNPGWEDLYITIAILLSVAFTALLRVQEDFGLGRHIWEVSSTDLVIQLQVCVNTKPKDHG